MWDFSKPPRASSKWLATVTAEDRDREARTAVKLRRDAEILRAGGTVSVIPRRRRVVDTPAARVPPAEGDEIRAFLGVHGHAIAAVLALAEDDETRLRIGRAYRAILRGDPGAHADWGALLASLGL